MVAYALSNLLETEKMLVEGTTIGNVPTDLTSGNGCVDST